MAKVKALARSELAAGAFRAADVGGQRIVVYDVEGQLFATAERCAHQGGPLGDGLLEGCIVTCPWHGWQFDVRTGVAVFDPTSRVATYPVHVEGDDIWIEV
jgi:nitrite reductase/ring-hydroxylating ferredoxin subunit